MTSNFEKKTLFIISYSLLTFHKEHQRESEREAGRENYQTHYLIIAKTYQHEGEREREG